MKQAQGFWAVLGIYHCCCLSRASGFRANKSCGFRLYVVFLEAFNYSVEFRDLGFVTGFKLMRVSGSGGSGFRCCGEGLGLFLGPHMSLSLVVTFVCI